MDGHGSQAAHTEYGLEGIGAGAQMGDGAQKLHGMALGLQGVIAGGGAFHFNGSGLDLKGLLAVGGQLQSALHDQGGADIDFGDFLEIGQGIVVHHLNGGEISTVIQDDETKLLGGAAIAHPAADGDSLVGIFGGVFKQLAYRNQFHNLYLLCKKL